MHANISSARNVVTRRSLGAFEEYFYLRKQSGSPTILLVVDVEGKVDPARWRAAVEAVGRRHPLLRSVITHTPPARPAFRVVKETIRKSARVLPLETADLEKFYRDELQTSFRLNETPWRQTLFLGEERSVLGISVDHAITDGIGAVVLVRDLLSVLAGATLDEAEGLSPSHDQLLGLMPNDFYLRERTPAFRDSDEAAPPTPKIEAALMIEHESIDDQTTRKIAAAARSNGTTVHGALTAAILFAGARLYAPWEAGPVIYMSPVDNRPFLNAMGQFGLIATVEHGEFVSGALDFWTLARRIRHELAQVLTLAHSAEAISAMRDAMDPQMLPEDSWQIIKPRNLVMTNYGSLPIASDYGALRITALRPHVTNSPYVQTVSAATIGGTLSLSNVSYALIPGLLAEAKKLLAEL